MDSILNALPQIATPPPVLAPAPAPVLAAATAPLTTPVETATSLIGKATLFYTPLRRNTEVTEVFTMAAIPLRKKKSPKKANREEQVNAASAALTYLSSATIHLRHITGCAESRESTPSPNSLSPKSKALFKQMESDDPYVRLIGLLIALDVMIDIGPAHKEYDILYTQATTSLDNLSGDIRSIFHSMPEPSEESEGRAHSPCCFLEDMPTLRAQIQSHLNMSPKYAFEKFETTYLRNRQEYSTEKLAKAFVEIVVEHAICYQELDGLREPEILERFTEIWTQLVDGEAMKVEIHKAYANRTSLGGAQKSIAKIMDLEQ